MRTPYTPVTHQRILCVSPRYVPSFGTFQYSYRFFGRRVRAWVSEPFGGIAAVGVKERRAQELLRELRADAARSRPTEHHHTSPTGGAS